LIIYGQWLKITRVAGGGRSHRAPVRRPCSWSSRTVAWCQRLPARCPGSRRTGRRGPPAA